MKKNLLTAILTGTMLASMLAGCGGGSDDTKSDGDSSNADGKTVVTLWHSNVSPEVEPFEEMLAAFNEQSKDVYVETEWVAREEQTKQLTIGNMAGELPDMVYVDNPEVISYGEMGVFQDIKELYDAWDENQLLESIINSSCYDGKMYGIPYSCNNLELFYNVDMFEEAELEPPATWDELVSCAETLTKDGVYGMAFSAIKNAECTFQFMPFLWSAEGDWTSMDSEKSIKAMTYYSDFVQKKLANKEVLNWSQADVCKQFGSGNCAMMINGSWNVGTLRNDYSDLNFGVVDIPIDKVNASCLGGESICITKDGNAEACMEFIEYFVGKDISGEYTKSISKFSPRSDVDNDELFGDDPVMKTFADALSFTYPRGPYPKWTEVDNAIIEACQASLTGEKTPEQACKDAAAAISEIQASLDE